MNNMNTLTNDQITGVSDLSAGYTLGHADCLILREISQRLLAAEAKLAELRGQEPVACVSEESFSSDGTSDILTINLPIGMELFSRPVPPAASQPYAAPDELSGKSFEYIANKFQVSLSEAQWILVGWNACRAAMLQHHSGDAANKVNYPVIPDGWAFVPFEPSTEMSSAGHVYYQKSKAEFGDFTPTGMYRAMLAAAPQHKGD